MTFLGVGLRFGLANPSPSPSPNPNPYGNPNPGFLAFSRDDLCHVVGTRDAEAPARTLRWQARLALVQGRQAEHEPLELLVARVAARTDDGGRAHDAGAESCQG